MTLQLIDRIVAELAEDPKTEDDLVVCFPKAGRQVIRVKVAELKRAGKITERDGVFRLRPGTDATAEVAAVTVERAATNAENARKVGQAIAAARKQRAVPPPASPPAPLRAKRELLPPPPLDPGPIVLEQLRTCTKCEVEKPLSAFGKRVKAKGGIRNECKACVAARQRDRMARLQAAARAIAEQKAAAAPAAVVAPAREPEPPAADVPDLKVLTFPGPKPAPKTLEEVANRFRATVQRTTAERIVVADPLFGVQYLVLSDEGLRALREHLATAAAG